MDRVSRWNQQLTSRALDGLGAIGGITIYGPRDPARRTSLVAFNLAGRDPVSVAQALNQAGIESRAGCHCATLAHHALGLTPPAELPPELLPLQHPGRGRPGRGGGGRDRSRPRHPCPRHPGPPVPLLVRPHPQPVMSGNSVGTSADRDGAARPAFRRVHARLGPGRLRAVLRPGRLPHTFPLCIHCLGNPAGFWVSSTGSSVVRGPGAVLLPGPRPRPLRHDPVRRLAPPPGAREVSYVPTRTATLTRRRGCRCSCALSTLA